MSSDSFTKTDSSIEIRWMIRRDMADVLQIERSSFEFHWSESDFLQCLRRRNCIGVVAEVKLPTDQRLSHHSDNPAEQPGTVVAFMVYELYKSRLHLLNFAVSPNYRNQGIGQMMIDRLISKLAQQRREHITLEVRETNLAAQLFFRNLGFQATGVLRNHYEDSSEDAYVMQFSLHNSEDDYELRAPNRIANLEEA